MKLSANAPVTVIDALMVLLVCFESAPDDAMLAGMTFWINFDSEPEGVIDPVTVSVNTTSSDSEPDGVLEPVTVVLVSFESEPDGVLEPVMVVLVSFESEPDGVLEPVRALNVDFVSTPVGVRLPETVWK